jgi:hypothetical protein
MLTPEAKVSQNAADTARFSLAPPIYHQPQLHQYVVKVYAIPRRRSEILDYGHDSIFPRIRLKPRSLFKLRLLDDIRFFKPP